MPTIRWKFSCELSDRFILDKIVIRVAILLCGQHALVPEAKLA